jgi:hypothetical protein
MGKFEKVLQKVLGGKSDANISFDDLCHLLRRLGFAERISGDITILEGKASERY